MNTLVPRNNSPAAVRSRAYNKYAVAGMIFVSLSLVAFLGLYAVYSIQAAANFSRVKNDEVWRAGVGASQQTSELNDLVKNLRYLIASNSMQRWLIEKDASSRGGLEKDFLALAASNAFYHQIRLLDMNGIETVRVDRHAGKLATVSSRSLQNKSGRYYFSEAMKLSQGQLYISPLDLNVENGVVEAPLRPTLRLASPVFDTDGKKQGILILNFSAAELLIQLRQNASYGKGEPWLLNNAGYWLIGPPAVEWAFMYPQRRDRTAERAYPEAWQEIVKGPASGQFMAAGDLFSYSKVALPAGVSSSPIGESNNVAAWSWVFVTHLPGARLAEMNWATAGPFLLIGAVLLPLFGFIAFVANDQYARRRDAEIQREAAEFRAHDERMATLIIESSPSAFVVIDDKGRVVQVNAAVERMFGYSRVELIGQMAEMMLPDRYRDSDGLIDDYFVVPETRGFKLGYGNDRVGLHKDGSEFIIEVGLGKMQIGDDRLLIASVADVSEQRKLQTENENERAEIRRLNASLEMRVAERTEELLAINRELEAFSYSVSHDLRSPLRTIDGFSQILEQDYHEQIDEAGQKHIARIRRSAQRMGELIDDLLKLSRISRGDLTRADIDLSAQVRQVSDVLRSAAPDRQVEIEIADGIRANGDARLLMIVFENLLGNAWKFTISRNPARIEFGQTETDGKVAYFVRDNGAGFDMAYAGKLFGAFQRLHSGSEFPGHGIGLATVQRIIGKHGGRIWAEAEPEKGAAFYFTL